MDYLPVFANLKDRSCLVVGGGAVALRKVRHLREAGARVTVNALELGPELANLAASGQIDYVHGPFQPTLVSRQFLTIAATDDVKVNERVFQTAEAQGRLVNTVDDNSRSSFINPAVVDRSPVVIAISSGGTAPVLARLLRARLETLLPRGLGALARLAGSLRDRVKKKLPSLDERRRFWERVFDGVISERVYSGRIDLAKERINELLDKPRQTAIGEVILVGAGPGDPGLLTLRALQVLQKADVIMHDRLVSQEVLDLARRDATFVDVGKRAGLHKTPQDEINRLLVEYAGQGKLVCRLKGGDPFVFGRGGEELEVVAAAGIPFQVVPGITAAVGCAAYAGIPLTHRELAHSVAFVTAHCQESLDCLDWKSLAREKHTLAFYMPVARLDDLADGLIGHGRPAATPVAIIERGTSSEQRVIRATLGTLSEVNYAENIESPSILIVGEVTALQTSLHWFGPESNVPEQPGKPMSQGLVAVA